MRCGNCGHQNPDDNRFCGMCGNVLAGSAAGEAEYALTNSGVPEQHETRPAEETLAKPVEARREAGEARPAEVGLESELEPAPAKPAKGERWWVDENETTVGGPSFLGLSNADSGGSEGYSYLFQEDEERSHKAAWVFVLVLLVLGGVVYAKWKPIRDYVLTTALTHARPHAPKADNNTPSTTTSSAPTTTVASSDAQAPPTITEEKKDQNKAGESKVTGAKEGLPEGGKQSIADNSKAGGETVAKEDQKQPAVAKDEAAAEEEDAPAVEEQKPSAAKKARAGAAPLNDGGELVSSGERYLYGRGVARSCNQAVIYFNAAAAKQNLQAFSHLGALYATGECVHMDRAVAYAWFRRAYAKEPSNHYFEQNLTMLWREMTADEKQRVTGRQ